MKNLLFINYLLSGDIASVKYWTLAIGIMALLVIISSLIDLRWGIKASKACGEFKTTSYGLRNTITKLESYMVFFFLSVMIDACLSFFVPMPVACIVVAVSEILIEGVSVYENKARAKNGVRDPIGIAKAVAKTFGITDAERIEALINVVKEGKVRDAGE